MDTCALAGPRQAVPLHGTRARCGTRTRRSMGRMRVGDSGSVVGLNPHWNVGNKPIARSGWSAMREFAEWSVMQDADVIIVGGHSLWFKEFFKAHLDFDAAKTHVAAKKKIVNGVVGVHAAARQTPGARGACTESTRNPSTPSTEGSTRGAKSERRRGSRGP